MIVGADLVQWLMRILDVDQGEFIVTRQGLHKGAIV